MLELNTTRQLLGHVLRRKLSFLGHTHREGGCQLVKTVIQGKVPGKRRRGRPRASYGNNITKWMGKTMSEVIRETQERDRWRRLVREASRAADHQPLHALQNLGLVLHRFGSKLI